MLTVEYCKEGEAINDFELDTWVRIAVRKQGYYRVSNFTAIQKIRIAVARQEIHHSMVFIVLDGVKCTLDYMGTPEKYPPHFRSLQLILAGDLIREMSMARKRGINANITIP